MFVCLFIMHLAGAVHPWGVELVLLLSAAVIGGGVCQQQRCLVYNKLFWSNESGPEQGIKLLGLLLTGSNGQHMAASRNGLALHTLTSKGFRAGWWQPLCEFWTGT